MLDFDATGTRKNCVFVELEASRTKALPGAAAALVVSSVAVPFVVLVVLLSTVDKTSEARTWGWLPTAYARVLALR